MCISMLSFIEFKLKGLSKGLMTEIGLRDCKVQHQNGKKESAKILQKYNIKPKGKTTKWKGEPYITNGASYRYKPMK